MVDNVDGLRVDAWRMQRPCQSAKEAGGRDLRVQRRVESGEPEVLTP